MDRRPVTFSQEERNRSFGCLCAVTVNVPSPIEAEIGDQLSIQCKPSASGSPKYSVEWFVTDQYGDPQRIATYSNGKSITDPGTQYSDRVSVKSDLSLVIYDVSVDDDRSFLCKVNAGSEGTATGSADLKVYDPPEPPELTMTGGILSVTESDAVEIGSCIGRNAYPAPTIEWYKNQQPLNPPKSPNKDLYMTSRTVREASGLFTVSSTLFLRPTKQDADSRFSCRVVFAVPGGSSGFMESKAFNLTLHFYTEDVKFELLSAMPIKEGDDVTFRCAGDGYPPPSYMIERVKDGTEEELYSGSDSIFIKRNVSREDSGVYRCHALDFDTPEEIILLREQNIFVHYLGPLSVLPQEPVTIPHGKDLQLFCSGDGSQKPHLSWKKGDKMISETSRYRLRDVSYADAGVYTCLATVPEVPGLMKEHSITVAVEGAPQLERGDEVVEVLSEGSMVTLTCSAQGFPEPEITWNPPELKSTQTLNGQHVISTVTMKALSKLMNDISCSARNDLGSAEKKFTLNMNSVSPSARPPQEQTGGSSTAIIAVVVCVILLLLVVALFYFLQKKGKLTCGSSEKQSLAQDPASGELAVELKSEKGNEQRGLLGSRGGGGQPSEC
ncbi:basal cell adhesion molecule isoform X1 [Xenopus laevis]|uniref:Basal cell adhesion molecule isoform X1 n=1 Tax=Xenopus laevis TaxID=8355 RepID=A0A8J0TG19_XENLA|nr:basal cell adhesion molecule isoform X1 [Xenopus laevis]